MRVVRHRERGRRPRITTPQNHGLQSRGPTSDQMRYRIFVTASKWAALVLSRAAVGSRLRS